MGRSNGKECVVIAVDLGTSCCKFCIDLLDDTNRVTGPERFRVGARFMSFPTALLYKGRTAEVWGPDALKSSLETKDFKLCTDFIYPLNSDVLGRSNAQEDPKPFMWEDKEVGICKDLDDVILDYLNFLYSYLVQDSIDWSRGKYRWLFTFSVPPYFSNADKERFENIIKIWNNLKKNEIAPIMRQSEAAALYAAKTRHSAGEKILYKMKIMEELPYETYRSKAFIVCDVGSRKLEITSYHLRKFEAHPQLRLKLTDVNVIFNPHTGSNTIDQAFLTHLRNGIPEPDKEEFILSDDETRSLKCFIEQKDKLKLIKDIKVPLFGLGKKHKEHDNGVLFINKELFNGFFEPFVKETTKALMQHIASAHELNIEIEFAVLVGSPALSRTFEDRVGAHLGSIPVWSPTKATYAVSRGMLMAAQDWPFQNPVKSRASYGIVKADGSIMWFFFKGDSYMTQSIRIFKHSISLEGRRDVLDVSIVRDSGDLEGLPQSKSESKRRAFTTRKFSVDLSDVQFQRGRRKFFQRGYRKLRILRRTFVKVLTFSFEVSEFELAFQFTFEGSPERKLIGRWDEAMEQML